MKSLIVFVIGVLVGATALATAINIPQTSKEAQRAISSARTKVLEVSYNQCVGEVNKRTHCRQDKNYTSKQCDAMIETECGKDPDLTKEISMK